MTSEEPYIVVKRKGREFMLVPYLHDPHDILYVPLYPTPDDMFHPDQQIFGYQARHDDGTPDGEALHIAVGKLWKLLRANPSEYELKKFEITHGAAQHITQFNGVERPHVERIMEGKVQVKLDDPGIMLAHADGKQTILDGNHRYVARFLLGKKAMAFWVVRMDQIQKCLIRVPQEIGRRLLGGGTVTMEIHKSITLERVIEAVERYNTSLDNHPGFCAACGEEQDGCEPDMRNGECESCGEHAVYGAEELLMRMV